jgi:hypothetical protein
MRDFSHLLQLYLGLTPSWATAVFNGVPGLKSFFLFPYVNSVIFSGAADLVITNSGLPALLTKASAPNSVDKTTMTANARILFIVAFFFENGENVWLQHWSGSHNKMCSRVSSRLLHVLYCTHRRTCHNRKRITTVMTSLVCWSWTRQISPVKGTISHTKHEFKQKEQLMIKRWPTSLPNNPRSRSILHVGILGHGGYELQTRVR